MTDEAQAKPHRARLFVACDLPPEALQAVAAWQRTELSRRDDLRVLPTVHLTLAFLGGVDAERVPDLEEILGRVRWRRADCRFKQPLFLPARGRPESWRWSSAIRPDVAYTPGRGLRPARGRGPLRA